MTPAPVMLCCTLTQKGGHWHQRCPGPFRGQVIQGGDADAAVALEVGVGAVGQAVPPVVVVGTLQVGDGLGVLVDDPVAAAGLEGDVVRHGQGGAARDEQLDLGGGGVGAGLGQGAVAEADGLAPELVVGFVAVLLAHYRTRPVAWAVWSMSASSGR